MKERLVNYKIIQIGFFVVLCLQNGFVCTGDKLAVVKKSLKIYNQSYASYNSDYKKLYEMRMQGQELSPEQERWMEAYEHVLQGNRMLHTKEDIEECEILRKSEIEVFSQLNQLGTLPEQKSERIGRYHRNKQIYGLKQAGVSLVPMIERWAAEYERDLEWQKNYRKRNKAAYDLEKAGGTLSADQERWAQLYKVNLAKHRIKLRRHRLEKKQKLEIVSHNNSSSSTGP